MVRKHGWQLPAHTFQVVAITVFFLLVIAFYSFFAPFIGGRILKYVAFGIYSPVALAVFILYVRCTAINPADPGIMDKFGGLASSKPKIDVGLQDSYTVGNMGEIGIHMSPSSISRSSMAGNSAKGTSLGNGRSLSISNGNPKKESSCCFSIGVFVCALFVKEDWCKREVVYEQQEQDALYCTYCNAEVRKFSKHCRCCDKCVDGFDHHCRWLNNCIGRKNYVTFFSLMATSVIWLVIEFGVGIAVLVRCFVDKKHMEEQIIDKLGNGFSLAPFIVVVIVCSAVSLLACVPLGELFFFHMILIRKGITTYEYVLAMRAMSEAPPGSVDEDFIPHSPTESANTGISGGSSLGIQYKGAWCTPPRVFVDYQDEVIPHLDPTVVPSTVDPDAAGLAERVNKLQKRPVRISAWKLAKLDSNEAMRAAAKARASSSVLRPVDTRRGPDADMSSNDNMSNVSSMSTDFGMNKEVKNDPKLSTMANSYPPSNASKEDYETGTHSVSSFSSPGHLHDSVSLSPLPLEQPSAPSATGQLPRFISEQSFPLRGVHPNINFGNQMLVQPSNSGFDDKMPRSSNMGSQVSSGQHISSVLRDSRRTSVVWDQDAGRYVSVPISARAETAPEFPLRPPSHATVNRASELSGNGRRPDFPESLTTRVVPVQKTESLMYTGQSIFFGGPLLSVPPVREAERNANSNTSVAPSQGRRSHVLRNGREGQDETSNQLPVFAPGSSLNVLPYSSQ